MYTTTQVQANLNNLDFDQAPLNFYSANNAVLKVEQSSGSEAGCSSTVTSSTQTSSIFSAAITSITGSGGSLTVTFGSVTGTLPAVGQTIGIRVANVTGGSGTINGVFTGVVASASTITYTSAGANATGAGLGSAIISSGNGVMYTWATPCAASLQPGDIFSLTLSNNSTANLGQTASGAILQANGGATISSESTDVCTAAQTVDPVTGTTGSGCGTQSLVCDTSTGNGASCSNYLQRRHQTAR